MFVVIETNIYFVEDLKVRLQMVEGSGIKLQFKKDICAKI
jgi:hypothetical protein